MRQTKTLVFASLNRKKFEEVRDLLVPKDLEVIEAASFLRNPEKLAECEIYETYLENALAKARLANLASHYPSLADDSGLEVQALDGRPGVKSARFAIPRAGETQDQVNLSKLLAELKGFPSKEKRVARFRTVMVLVMEGIHLEAEGVLEGTLTESPRGSHGFGYDPVFIPIGETRTLAQMGLEEKNRFSHRAIALTSLFQKIEERGIRFARP